MRRAMMPGAAPSAGCCAVGRSGGVGEAGGGHGSLRGEEQREAAREEKPGLAGEAAVPGKQM